MFSPHETMIIMMFESTSSSRNVYEVDDTNNYIYRNIVMDVTRMYQGDACECPIIDKKNIMWTKHIFLFFKIL